jgi:hypothetical protein
MTQPERASPLSGAMPKHQHVAFLDVLGFASRVLSDYAGALSLYTDLIGHWDIHNRAYSGVRLTVYSDSLMLVSEKLLPLLQAITTLHMLTMNRRCLLRGGVASGLHVEVNSDGNSYVVSDPLTRAAVLEKTVGDPCVAIDDSVVIPPEWWPAEFPNVHRPILWFENRRIVNPFHRYWYLSAKIVVTEMRTTFPKYQAKYDWFLRLYEAVGSEAPLIPPEFALHDG